MTDKITLTLTLDELKELDKNLYYCEETWGICDKIRNAYPKSPVVEAYKDWYGEYPPISPDADKRDIARWHGFQAGYNAPKEEKVSETAQERGERVHNEMEELVRESVKWCEEHPDTDPLDWLKPQNPEQTEQSLKEAFIEAQKTEKWKEIQKLIDEEDNDKNFKNSLDLIKEWGEKNKPITLKELLWEWWEDIFTVDADLDADASIDVLVDRIEEFLPKEHCTNSYKWNQCIRTIKEKLR